MSDDRPWHTFDSEGRCIAWLHSLPDGTRFLLADDGRSDARIAPTAPPLVNAFDRPVVVVAWPDGSTPKPEGAGYEYEVVAADGWWTAATSSLRTRSRPLPSTTAPTAAGRTRSSASRRSSSVRR